MDRFEAMRAFVQVVESGSFTKAAQQLGLHKASVSQQVLQLEDKLGTRLLTRTTRQVTPTPEGLLFHERARAILQQLDDAETTLRQGSRALQGRLRVDVPVAVGRMLFAQEIRGFLERHPGITVELGCTDRLVDLVAAGVDCALRGGDLPDSGLVARPVGALRFVLCAAPRHLERHGLPQTPEALAGHHQVGFVAGSTGLLRPLRLQRDGQALELELPARFVTTDSAAALAAALDGLGVVQLAEFVAAPYLDSGALVRLLPGWRCPSLPMHWLTPTSRRRPARVQAFIDWAHALLLRRLGPHLD
ncbi:LysR family transcriptional regulator [Rubrivivax gelatinosus]|nr:LysR family transcriptional regulator [Rubrivivax gelatinosus]